jgi:cytoskeletal protein CcmA (bactofilin family)
MAYNNNENNNSYTSGSNQSTHSYLGKTVKIKGEIKSEEHITIEGKITGNIVSSNDLTIGKNGFVNGEINAESVKIDGKAEGNISATRKLEISSIGTFAGSLKSDNVVIMEGAIFKGNINLAD